MTPPWPGGRRVTCASAITGQTAFSQCSDQAMKAGSSVRSQIRPAGGAFALGATATASAPAAAWMSTASPPGCLASAGILVRSQRGKPPPSHSAQM